VPRVPRVLRVLELKDGKIVKSEIENPHSEIVNMLINIILKYFFLILTLQ
jgi:hypothetical protein